jgi:cytochrome P450
MQVVDPTTGTPLTQAQLCSELVFATLAGFETTSNALTYTLGMLATHPQALGRLEQVGGNL